MKNKLRNLDMTFGKFGAPLLKEFRKETNGHPNSFKNMEDWLEVIDKMIFAFEYLESGKVINSFENHEEYERYREGMKLFAEHLHNLWI